MRLNLHNHTICSDGALLPIQIVREAVDQGMDLVGLTDHILTSPHPIRTVTGDTTGEPHLASIGQFTIDDPPDITGLPITIPTYLTFLETLKSNFQGTIQIIAGGEIHFPANASTLEHHLGQLGKFDFILCEHVSETCLGEFLAFRNRVGVPVGLAHTTFPTAFPEYSTQDLINLFIRERIFVEFNTSYPDHFRESREFFEAARETQLVLSMGTDTHHMLGHMRDIHIAERFAADLGLQDNFDFWNEFKDTGGFQPTFGL